MSARRTAEARGGRRGKSRGGRQAGAGDRRRLEGQHSVAVVAGGPGRCSVPRPLHASRGSTSQTQHASPQPSIWGGWRRWERTPMIPAANLDKSDVDKACAPQRCPANVAEILVTDAGDGPQIEDRPVHPSPSLGCSCHLMPATSDRLASRVIETRGQSASRGREGGRRGSERERERAGRGKRKRDERGGEGDAPL